MTSIAEALVATAVGLAVAIPAVAANNYFQRLIKSILANTEALSRVLLSHLKTDPAFAIAGGGSIRSARGEGGGGRRRDDPPPNRKVAAREDEDEGEE
jgi:biopolymer transport protein ExbB